jgi:membrane protein involved in D-alanine export
VIPYADFTFFGLLLYPVLATLILGLLGRAGRCWALLVTVAAVILQYSCRPVFGTREIWILAGFGAWEYAVVRAFKAFGARPGWPFYLAVGASLGPLVASKAWPLVSPGSEFGFLGISYVTFRVLDIVFCLRDKVALSLNAADFLGCLFFFPTISSGPIDRYRRFTADLGKKRTRAEFLQDLDGAIHRLFRGFFYKFIIAALINNYWLEPSAKGRSLGATVSYMYAYSFYLFFDFAGYCAFAIALSYLFGVHTPENFNRPFLARNIREFWNRWHMTLSFWFRDHVYMRFLLTARRRNWFHNNHTASIAAYFLSFGLMGLWHGPHMQYIAYGLYQALLLTGFDIYSRWNKARGQGHDSRFRHAAGVFITFQCVCFGFLIFSGHLNTIPSSP